MVEGEAARVNRLGVFGESGKRDFVAEDTAVKDGNEIW